MSCSKIRAVRRHPSLQGAALAILLPAGLAAGCAAPASYTQPNWIAATPPRQFDPEAVVAKAREQAPASEDDGRPSQLPPRLAARALPDDPTQPWSPNYGGPAQRPKASTPALPSTSAQDRSATEALQYMAARRVTWQRGN